MSGYLNESRVLTYTLHDGREIMVTVFGHGEITVAERARSDYSVSWGPPQQPTHDSSTPRGIASFPMPVGEEP